MVDLTATEVTLLGRLGAVSGPDLDWCTASEIYGWFNEALNRLAELGLFVSHENQATVDGQGNYPLPSDWLGTIFASVDGSQVRPSSAADLLALDSSWAGAVCGTQELPSRYAMDGGPFGTLTLYPAPGAVHSLDLIDQIVPPAISTTQTTAPINALLQDYFLYFALARARKKESDHAMPEVADAAMQMVQLYEQILTSYWGGK